MIQFRSARLIGILIALISMFGFTQVWADCQGTETTGDDTIVCDTNPAPPLGFETTPVTGNAGNDTIIVEAGTVIATGVVGDGVGGITGTVPVSPNPGDDTIIVDGSVQYVDGNGGDDTIIVGETGQVTNVWDGVEGGSGNDTIIIEGDVEGHVYGGDGDDNITVGGSVIVGGVDGEAGSDTITLVDGAGANGEYSLYVYGGTGPGEDVLIFDLTITDQETYDLLVALINANVSSGSITINGETYYWYNFESLVNLLRLVLGVGGFTDGRLDGNPGQTAVLFCNWQEPGVYALSVQGAPLFEVSQQQIDTTVSAASSNGENQQLADVQGQSFWALTSDELLLHSNDGKYDYVFPADTCAS